MKVFSKNKIKVLIEMRLIIVVKLYNNFCSSIWYGRFRYVVIEGVVFKFIIYRMDFIFWMNCLS